MVRTAQEPTCGSVKLILRFACASRVREGADEVWQDGRRLALLPRLAFFALWDSTGEAYVVPRAKASIPEAALPGGSYASGQTPIAKSTIRSDTPTANESRLLRVLCALIARPAPLVPLILHKVTHLLPTMCSDLHGKSEVTDRVDPAQGDPQHVCATRSAKLDQDGLIHVESDESESDEDSSSAGSEGSATSAETVDSSTFDPHEPDAAPGVDAPDLAAILATHDVTQVVSEDVNAPLVTIALDEAALAPAVLLLRLPYLERLLEAVRSGIPLEGLAEALRPASCQAHDDLATYLTELVLALFDASQLRGLQGPLEPFGACGGRCHQPPSRCLLHLGRLVSDDLAQVQGACDHLAIANSVSLLAAASGGLPACPAVARLPSLKCMCLRRPSSCTYLAAYWRVEMPYTPTADFLRWYMARVTAVLSVLTCSSICKSPRCGWWCTLGSPCLVLRGPSRFPSCRRLLS